MVHGTWYWYRVRVPHTVLYTVVLYHQWYLVPGTVQRSVLCLCCELCCACVECGVGVGGEITYAYCTVRVRLGYIHSCKITTGEGTPQLGSGIASKKIASKIYILYWFCFKPNSWCFPPIAGLAHCWIRRIAAFFAAFFCFALLNPGAYCTDCTWYLVL